MLNLRNPVPDHVLVLIKVYMFFVILTDTHIVLAFRKVPFFLGHELYLVDAPQRDQNVGLLRELLWCLVADEDSLDRVEVEIP